MNSSRGFLKNEQTPKVRKLKIAKYDNLKKNCIEITFRSK